MTKHIHADLIIAWANGAKIQFKYPSEEVWEDTNYPDWIEGMQYRIKPKSPEEYSRDAIQSLKSLQGYNVDVEAVHGIADDILCDLLIDLGFQDVVDEYNKVEKWYA